MTEWEIVKINNQTEQQTDVTTRLKVHGGWIVRSCNFIQIPAYEVGFINNVLSESSVFVPDINHDWKLEVKNDD